MGWYISQQYEQQHKDTTDAFMTSTLLWHFLRTVNADETHHGHGQGGRHALNSTCSLHDYMTWNKQAEGNSCV